MNNIKRIAAFVMAAAMLTAFAGCGDQSWSYRTGDTSLSAGTYIMNLLNAYYEAYDKVESPDEVKKILDEEIEDSDGEKKTVEQYAIDGADAATMKMLAVETLFKQYGLELDQEEYDYNNMYMGSAWSYNKDMFEGYGISEESFRYTMIEYNVKYGQVFKKLYGKDGEKAVSDEEMTKYFSDKYTGYAYFNVSAATTDEATGESVALSDQEYKKTEDFLKKYVDMVNKNGKSYEETVKTYMKDFNYPNDPTLSGSVELEKATLNETVLETLKTLDEGKAAYVAYGSEGTSSFYFVYRPKTESIIDFLESDEAEDAEGIIPIDTFDDASTASDTAYVAPLKSGYSHASLLNDMKKDDFEDYLKDFANTLNVEKNSAILNGFKPKMFVKKNSDA